MKKCDASYGIGIEVRCPNCKFGTWIGDISETHECSHCGAEFKLSEEIVEQHNKVVDFWRSL